MSGRRRRSRSSSSSSTPSKRRCTGGHRGGGDAAQHAQVPRVKSKSSTEIRTESENRYPEFIHKDRFKIRAQLLCKEMLPRYKKTTSIGMYGGDGHDPVSYCYVDDCSDPPPSEDHHYINYYEPSEHDPVIPHEYRNAWKSLTPEKCKEELFIMLSVFRTLERLLEYRPNCWQEKYPISLDEADSDETQAPNLLSYGDPDPSGKTFLQLLQGSKSQEAIAQDITQHQLQELEVNFDLWNDALLKQMTNGAARAALNDTLNFISRLLRNMPQSMVPAHCMPLVIGHYTSPTPNDGFSVSDCGHKAVTRCCSASRSKSHSKSHSRSASQKERPKTSSSSGLKTHSRSYPDLAVVCADRKKKEAKYVLLVEIHSHGKTLSTALGKFKKELVHVLQGQNEVFGLFISHEEFQFFRAERLKNQKIIFRSTGRRLNWRPVNSNALDHLNVESLQELVMHIFSCFVYGVSCIKVWH